MEFELRTRSPTRAQQYPQFMTTLVKVHYSMTRLEKNESGTLPAYKKITLEELALAVPQLRTWGAQIGEEGDRPGFSMLH